MADVFDVSGSVRLDTRRAEKDLSRFVRKAEGVDLKLAINDRNFTQPLGRITGAAQEFNKSLAASNARVVAFAASAGLLYAVQRAFVAMAQSAIEVEHTLQEINVILGVSTKTLGQFGDALFKVAAQTGQSFSTVAIAATELSRQGLSMEETLKRTKDAMILVRLAGMDAESSVNALTAAINSFNAVALDSTEIINKMANVDAAFAVSTNDLAEALKRVGSSAIDAGVSFDQLLAVVTSVQQTTARGGAVIGNSLKSIFTRIQRTEVLDQLEMLGFQVRNLKGETLPALKVMTDLAKNIDKLTAAQKASVTEMMGGVFQINVVKAALGDLGKEYSIYENALRTSINTTDEAILRNEQLNETLKSLVNKTFQNVQKAAAEVGKLTIAPALERALGGINSVLESFDPKKADSVGEKVGVGIMEGLGKFISGPGMVVGIALLGKLLINFSKFVGDSFREFFKLNEAAKGRLAIEQMVTQELGESEDLTQAILRGELSVIDAEEVILKNLQERVKQQEKLNQLIKTAAYGLEKKGVSTSLIEGTDEYAVRPPRTTNKGFIPRYSEGNIQDLVRDELKGASYTNNNSRAIIDTLPGIGQHVRNSEENVVYAKGMKSPFINPPLNSPEGKLHRDNAIRQTGINPYSLSSWGFVPGFAGGKKTGKREVKTKDNTKTLQAKKKGEGVVLPTRGKSYNTTFNETTSAVFAKSPQDKAAWKKAGVEHWSWKGPRVAQLRGPEDKISDFDKIIDAALEGGIQTVGKHLAGGDIDIEKKSGKFSQWFDSAGWPQVRGRVFEAGLNYIRTSVQGLATETASPTWDFANIQDQLATLYNVKPGGDYDAKPNVSEKGNRASMIHKAIAARGLVPAAGGFIPNFAMTEPQVMERIRQYKDDELRSPNGVRTQIAHSGLSGPVKQRLNDKLADAVKAKRAAKDQKTPGAKIDGKQLATMLVPAVGTSAGKGEAHPLPADRALLEKWLNKNYHLQSGGIKYKDLSKREQDKVYKGVKVSFPVNAANKGSASTLVDDMNQAMEMETRQFISSLKGADYAGTASVDKYLDTHKGEIAGAAGAVFESGVKSAFDIPSGKTSDRFDTPTEGHQGLREIFGVNTPWADFKIEDNSPLRQDMASKILKHKMKVKARRGFIPGFADPNRMRESMQAGVPYDKTYTSFVDTQKYTGPVVGNKEDEPTYKALTDAVKAHRDPKNAGKYRGFIPGFAEKEGFMPSADLSPLKEGGNVLASDKWSQLTAAIKDSSAGAHHFQGQLANLKDFFESFAPVVEVSQAKLEEFKGELATLREASVDVAGPKTSSDEAVLSAETAAAKTKGDIDSENTAAGKAAARRDALDAPVQQARDKIREAGTRFEDVKPAVTFPSNYKLSQAMVVGKGGRQSGKEALGQMKPEELKELNQEYSRAMNKAVETLNEMVASGESDEAIQDEYNKQLKNVSGVLKEKGLELSQAGDIELGNRGPGDRGDPNPRGKRGTDYSGGLNITDTGMERVQASFLSGGRITTRDETRAAFSGQATTPMAGSQAMGAAGQNVRDAMQKQEEAQSDLAALLERRAAAETERVAAGERLGKLEQQAITDLTEISNAKSHQRSILDQQNDIEGKITGKVAAIAAEEQRILDAVEEQRALTDVLNDKDEQIAKLKDRIIASAKTVADNEAERAARDEATARKETKRVEAGASVWGAAGHEGVFSGLGIGGAAGKRRQLAKILAGKKVMTAGDDAREMNIGDFGFTDQGTAQQSLQQAQGAARGSLQGAAMTAAFTLPMVTQTMSQFFDEDSKKAKVSEAVGGIGSFAAMGASFGPWGIAGGAAIGGLMELPKLLKSWEDETAKFNKQAELAKVKLTEWNNASQAYLKALSEFSSSLLDTSGKTTTEDMLKKQENLQKSLMMIPEEFQNRMFEAQGNVEKIQEIFAEIQDDMQRRAEGRAAAAKIEEMVEEKEGDRGKYMWGGEEGEIDKGSLQEMMKASLDYRKFLGAEGKLLAQELRDTGAIIGQDTGDFFRVLQKAGMSPEIVGRLKKMNNRNHRNFVELMGDMDLVGTHAIRTADKTKILATEMSNYNTRNDELVKAQQSLNSMWKKSEDQIVHFTSVLVERLNFVNKMSLSVAEGQRNALMTRVKGSMKAAAPFMDTVQKQQVEAQLKLVELSAKNNTNTERAEYNLRTALVSSLGKEFNKLSNSIDQANTSQTKGQLETNKRLGRQIKLRAIFIDVMNKAAQKAAEGGTAQEIRDVVEKLLPPSAAPGTRPADDELRSMERNRILTALTRVIEKNDQSLALLKEKADQQREQLEINNHYQQIIAENTKKIGQLGDVGTYLKDSKQGQNKIIDIFSKRAMAEYSMDRVSRGQGDLNILNLMRNFAGLSGMALPPQMRERGVQALESNMSEMIHEIEGQLRGMEGGAESGALIAELNQLKGALRDVAETKVAALLKDIPTHLQGIKETLDDIKGKTLGQQEAEESFERALVRTLGGRSSYLREPLLEIQGLIAFQTGLQSLQGLQESVTELTTGLRAIEGIQRVSFNKIIKAYDKTVEGLPDDFVNQLSTVFAGQSVKGLRARADNLSNLPMADQQREMKYLAGTFQSMSKLMNLRQMSLPAMAADPNLSGRKFPANFNYSKNTNGDPAGATFRSGQTTPMFAGGQFKRDGKGLSLTAQMVAGAKKISLSSLEVISAVIEENMDAASNRLVPGWSAEPANARGIIHQNPERTLMMLAPILARIQSGESFDMIKLRDEIAKIGNTKGNLERSITRSDPRTYKDRGGQTVRHKQDYIDKLEVKEFKLGDEQLFSYKQQGGGLAINMTPTAWADKGAGGRDLTKGEKAAIKSGTVNEVTYKLAAILSQLGKTGQTAPEWDRQGGPGRGVWDNAALAAFPGIKGPEFRHKSRLQSGAGLDTFVKGFSKNLADNTKMVQESNTSINALSGTYDEHKESIDLLGNSQDRLRQETDSLANSFSVLSAKVYKSEQQKGESAARKGVIDYVKKVREKMLEAPDKYGPSLPHLTQGKNLQKRLMVGARENAELMENRQRSKELAKVAAVAATKLIETQKLPDTPANKKQIAAAANASRAAAGAAHRAATAVKGKSIKTAVDIINQWGTETGWSASANNKMWESGTKYGDPFGQAGGGQKGAEVAFGSYENSIRQVAQANEALAGAQVKENLRRQNSFDQWDALEKKRLNLEKQSGVRKDYLAEQKFQAGTRKTVGTIPLTDLRKIVSDPKKLAEFAKHATGDKDPDKTAFFMTAMVNERARREAHIKTQGVLLKRRPDLRERGVKSGMIGKGGGAKYNDELDMYQVPKDDPLGIYGQGKTSILDTSKIKERARKMFGSVGKEGDTKFKKVMEGIETKRWDALEKFWKGEITPAELDALETQADLVLGRQLVEQGTMGKQTFAALLSAEVKKGADAGQNVDTLFSEFLKTKASLNDTDISDLKRTYAEGVADAVSPDQTESLKTSINNLFNTLKTKHGEGVSVKNLKAFAMAVVNSEIVQRDYLKNIGTTTGVVNSIFEELQTAIKNMDKATVEEKLKKYGLALGKLLTPIDELDEIGKAMQVAAPGATTGRKAGTGKDGKGDSALMKDSKALAAKYKALYNAGKITQAAVQTLINSQMAYKNALSNHGKEILSTAALLASAAQEFENQLKDGTYADVKAAYNELIRVSALGKGQKDSKKTARDLFMQTSGDAKRKGLGGLGNDASAIAIKYDAMWNRNEITGKQKDALQAAETKINVLKKNGMASLEELSKAYEEFYQAARGTNIQQKAYIDALTEKFGGKGAREKSAQSAIQQAHLDAAGGFGNLREMEKFTSETDHQYMRLKELRKKGLISQDEFLKSLKAEIDYKTAVRDLAMGRTTSGEFKAVADAALKAKRSAGASSANDFWRSFKARFKYGKNEAVWAMEDMVLGMVDTFESQMNSALFSLITGAKTAKEAFKDLADAMLDEITRMAVQAAVRATMGNVFAALGNKGGAAESLPVKKFSRGGSVVGGSGMRDDVPAMLSSGEYVINKGAVRKFGAGYFAKLNESATNGAVVKLASGGDPGSPTSVEVPEGETGQSMYARLKAKYGNRFTNYSGPAGGYYIDPEDAKDHPNDKSYRNYSLDPSGRMSKSAAVRRSARMGFLIEQDLMYGGRDPSSGLTTSYRASGTGIDAVFRNAFVYGDRTHPKSGKLEMDSRLSRMALADPNNPMNKMRMDKQKSFFDYAESQRKEMEDYRGRLDQAAKSKRDRWRQTFYTLAMIAGMGALGTVASGGSLGDLVMRGGNQQVRAKPFSGKAWTAAAGGRATGGDNIPALLMGGEYVMSRRSVDTYGRGFFDKLNRGEAPGFAEGGLVTDSSRTPNSSVGGSSFSGADHTNNINITVNVDGRGNATDQGVLSTSVGGGRSSDREGKAFAQQLESAVVKVISDQKRQGGLLSRDWVRRRG